MRLILIDKVDKRKKNLESKLKNAGFEVTSYKQVWGDKTINTTNWTDVKKECENILVSDTACLFIHSSNDQSKAFINLFLEKFKDGLVVSYSGAPVGSEIDIDHVRHHPFSSSVNDTADADWNLNAFLQAIVSKIANPFDTLLGMNQTLESLIHLHKSLSLIPLKNEDYGDRLPKLEADERYSLAFELLEDELKNGNAQKESLDTLLEWTAQKIPELSKKS